jgi:hypothetical protein
MRMILVGAMVAMAVVAGPAFASMSGEPSPLESGPGNAVHESNPTARVIHEDHHGAGAEFGLGLASVGLSIVYAPFRVVYGLVGAGLGGFGGWTTGGDMRTAEALWRPTVDGHYFIRPGHLDGRERFRFNGAVPAVREPETFDQPIPQQEAGELEPLEGPATDADASHGEIL